MKKTILLVDDSAMICHVVGKILRESGYEVLIARNGQEGLDLAKKRQPHLIIMDLEMPVMDGIQATTLIKAESQTANIPVLILTSLGGEQDVKRAKEAGCHGFLNKPICKNVIHTEIMKVLGNPG